MERFTVSKYFLETCGLRNGASKRVVFFAPPCLPGERALFVNVNLSDAVRKKPLCIIRMVSEAGEHVSKK